MKMIDYNLLKGKITAMQSTEPEYAYNFLNNAQNPSTEWECIEDMLDNMEVHEAKPVKHGRWIGIYEYCEALDLRPTGLGAYYWCSECDKAEKKTSDFCPNCGARMDGDTD